MTLAKQLVLLIVALFVVVFLGTVLINLHHTRGYLNDQLSSHAGDAATSLALSITPEIENGDMVTAETMMDAIFNGGDYHHMELRKIDGSVLVERDIPVVVDDVPVWFIDAFPLQTPTGEALVMSGWTQFGRLLVKSHPGYAYQQLWHTTVGSFWWFLAMTAGALIFCLVALRFLLKPLYFVERQARAICDREFPMQERMPLTRELASIATAMNRMTAKVKQMLTDAENLALDLRREAHRDPVTGLNNRRWFDQQLAHRLASEQEFGQGILGLVQLRDFKAYNQQHGYPAGDSLLKQLGDNLTEASSEFPDVLLAHLSGADFALLVADMDRDLGSRLGESLGLALNKLAETHTVDPGNAGHIGLAWFDGGQSAAELLSEADMALRTARAKGGNAWHQYSAGELHKDDVMGAGEWRRRLGTLIANGELELHFQPVFSVGNREILHHEVFARLPDGRGGSLPAGLFVPAAQQLGLMGELDRVIVARVLEHCAEHGGDHSVNVSAASIADGAFTDWLSQRLSAQPDLAKRLIFEWPEYAVQPYLGELRELIAGLRPMGVRFCLDHFGRGFGGFGYLHSLKLDLIKIDGSFVRGLHQQPDHRFYLRSVADIAHGLDARVIAETVENAEEWQAIQQLNIDGAQGYSLARPGPLPGHPLR